MARTAFHTQYGLYGWMILPMGLTNASAMFMQAMDNLFTNLLKQGSIVFLEDVLVYSHSKEEHVQLLHKVFDKLCEHQFYCKLKK